MAHELDQIDGTTLFTANRLPGWHGLGNLYTGQERYTLAAAMDDAFLTGWNVRTCNFIGLDDDMPVIQEDWVMTVRNNPMNSDAPAQPLGIVSPGYQTVQNEDAFAFGQNLIDDGLEVEAAGSIKRGRQTFVLFRIPKTVDIGGDKVYPYLHVTTSHDGSLAVTANLTGVRVVCANTQAMALAAPTPRYTVRHYGEDLAGRLEDARNALGIAYKGLDAFERQMDQWLNTQVTNAKFDAIMEAAFPAVKDETPLQVRNREANVLQVRALHDDSPTNALIKGTAWGVAQSMLEWQDWFKGSTKDKARAAAQVSTAADQARRQTFATIGRVLAI